MFLICFESHIMERELKSEINPITGPRYPGGSRKLWFPDFMKTAQDGGRLSALHTGRIYPQELLLLLIYVRGKHKKREKMWFKRKRKPYIKIAQDLGLYYYYYYYYYPICYNLYAGY